MSPEFQHPNNWSRDLIRTRSGGSDDGWRRHHDRSGCNWRRGWLDGQSGVCVATGLQEKFSWKGVAMSALSGAIGSGVGASHVFKNLGSFARGALSAATSSTPPQGIGVATGLQKKFDWAGIAAAAIAGGVSGKLSRNLQPLADNASIANIASHLGASMVGAVANATVRTALTNKSFGDNCGGAAGCDRLDYRDLIAASFADGPKLGYDMSGFADDELSGDASSVPARRESSRALNSECVPVLRQEAPGTPNPGKRPILGNKFSSL